MTRLASFLFFGLALSALFAVTASAEWGAVYCEGEGCPTRYMIEGFEVWVSPSLEANPAYSHSYLERYLDTVQAQLLYMGSVGVIPQSAMNALRDSGMTIYIDDPENYQEWWPCSPEQRGCYAPDTNRIGASFWGDGGNVMNGWHWQSFILHEAAHAYHWEVVIGRYDNQCIIDAYERNKHRYRRVEDSSGHSGIPPHEGVQVVQHWAYNDQMEYFAELSDPFPLLGDQREVDGAAAALQDFLQGTVVALGIGAVDTLVVQVADTRAEAHADHGEDGEVDLGIAVGVGVVLFEVKVAFVVENEFKAVRSDMAELRERLARMETLLEQGTDRPDASDAQP